METLIATIVITLIILLFTFTALFFGYCVGRRKSRCACAAAKKVMNQIEARKKAAKQAEKYNVETINPQSLPIVPGEVADHIRGK